jgi:hypothetical protein
MTTAPASSCPTTTGRRWRTSIMKMSPASSAAKLLTRDEARRIAAVERRVLASFARQHIAVPPTAVSGPKRTCLGAWGSLHE